jgi:hypothetical protein
MTSADYALQAIKGIKKSFDNYELIRKFIFGVADDK